MKPARVLKNGIQEILSAFNYRLTYSPKGRINGLSFSKDIKLLVTCDVPICFDVGANEGQTIELLQQIFGNPRIYAFEPSSESFNRLQSLKLPSEVRLCNLALGEKNRQEEFINYEDSKLSSFLNLDQDPENRFRRIQVKTKEVVEVRTIDWFMVKHQIQRIHLLKIDTQGFDLEVLRGATKTLQKRLIDNVFVELNFVKMYRDQSDAHLISAFLAEHNIHLVDYYEKERQNHILGWCNALYTRRV